MSNTRIQVRENGPLLIQGECELVDAQGNAFGLGGRVQFALCRCGQSANAPFCDGTHGRAGFRSACPARELPPAAKG